MANIQDSTRKDHNDTYVNLEELEKEAKLSRSMEKEMSSKKFAKPGCILAVLIAIMTMFLILAAITGFLLKNYLAMSREMLRHETLEQHLLQDISDINKTLAIYCRTCPSGWQPIGLFCYYFSKENVTWEDARDDCIRKGSGLLLLKTKEETDVLKAPLEKDRFWIGLTRDAAPKNWTWLDGSVMSFSNWHRGEPNNIRGNENCTESWNGLWNDRPCMIPQKYACKKGCCC